MTDRSAKRLRADEEVPAGADDPVVDGDGLPDSSAALNEVQEELNKVRSDPACLRPMPHADVSTTGSPWAVE